jgi:hypothetical protein
MSPTPSRSLRRSGSGISRYRDTGCRGERLGISTGEMEAMVRRGTVRSLMAGWTVVVPAIEVERLRLT